MKDGTKSPGYMLALNIIHKQERQNQSIEDSEQIYSKTLKEALDCEVTDLKSALTFLIDFLMNYNERSSDDNRRKMGPWDDIRNSFFVKLHMSPNDINGQPYKLKTIKTACEKIGKPTLQNFYKALDEVKTNDDKKNQENPVYRFLKELETNFIEQ